MWWLLVGCSVCRLAMCPTQSGNTQELLCVPCVQCVRVHAGCVHLPRVQWNADSCGDRVGAANNSISELLTRMVLVNNCYRCMMRSHVDIIMPKYLSQSSDFTLARYVLRGGGLLYAGSPT